MEGIITFFANLFTVSVFERVDAFNGLVEKIFSIVFKLETEIAMVLTNVTALNDIYKYLYSIGVLLLIAKFLQIGIVTYIAWVDGDVDASPMPILIKFGIAIFFLVGFPTFYEMLYEFFAEVTTSIFNSLKSIKYTGTDFSSLSTLEIFGKIIGGVASGFVGTLLGAIMLVVYAINLIIMLCTAYKKGAEMIILRLGFPLVVANYLTNDKTLFNAYLQTMVKIFLTILIQQFCLQLSLLTIMSMGASNTVAGGGGFNGVVQGMCISIGFLILANSTPALLNQFIIPTQSQGIMQKAQGTAMFANSVRGLMRGK